jgi:endonuclease/exonuclease/phosphatase family metal-dependent hydrolase
MVRGAVAAILVSLALGVNAAPLSSTPNPATAAARPCREIVPRSAPAVRWWSPPGDRDRANLLRWCQTVGPVLFQPAPDHPAAHAIDRLAIVSWNLHVGGGDVDGLIRRLRAGEFTGGESIEHFVLLLQEAYRRDETIPAGLGRGWPVPSRIAADRDRGPDIGHFWRDDRLAVLYAPSMRNGLTDRDREDRGNGIVSTLRLDDAQLVELPFEHQRRVAVASTVEGTTHRGSPWRVRVVDVHLDTALAITHGGPFAARRRQAEALVAALTQPAPRAERALSSSRVDEPSAVAETTIVAGDFNTWGGRERALDTLKRAFPDAPDSDAPPTWVGPLGIHATLDHVFARGRVSAIDVRRLPDRFGSDHYPLLALVRF